MPPIYCWSMSLPIQTLLAGTARTEDVDLLARRRMKFLHNQILKAGGSMLTMCTDATNNINELQRMLTIMVNNSRISRIYHS